MTNWPHAIRPAFAAAVVYTTMFFAVPSPAVAQNRAAARPITIANCRMRVVDEVQLASERSGIVDEVAPAGTYVAAGSTVARLRDSLARASLAIAEKEASNDIEVRFARKAAQFAELNYEKALQANRALPGTVAEIEMRELRLAAEKSLLQLEQAEHLFQIAGLRRDEQRETIQTLRIVAPFDAFVRLAHKKPGEVVGEGEVILEIVNTDRFRVEGYVDVADLPHVAVNSPVQVMLTGDGVTPMAQNQAFVGRIVYVDVKVEPVSQKVRVWAEVYDRERSLRDGLVATMFINPDQRSLR